MSDKCPICGGRNDCEAQRSESISDCWCFHIPIPKELLASIPVAERGKSCVCKACVIQYHSDQAVNEQKESVD